MKFQFSKHVLEELEKRKSHGSLWNKGFMRQSKRSPK